MEPTSANPKQPAARGTMRAGLSKLLSLCNNPLSLLGLFMVGLSIVLITAFTGIALFSERSNPYVDLVGFLILPQALVFGLVVVPIGVLWKRRWLRKHVGEHVPRYVQIDLSDAPTRGAAIVFMLITLLVVLPGLSVSAYEGYNYTESTEFCANVCHTVMEPEGTAHARSAHARVSCAECHIGAGADWFVKSKLSGTRQVIAVWRDSFRRPIPPAIHELRPARDTCEECHWPDRFFGSQLKQVVHYAPDEQNTRRVVRMLIKTGGADESIGRVEGIHMHMVVSGHIEYVATDDKLQEIPWVRHVSADGTATVYRADKLPADAPPPVGTRRTIDCMDCHNRGAHHFLPPQKAIDLQLEAGRIDPTLPFIKREAVQALVGEYADVPAAEAGIASALTKFYQDNYPTVWESSPEVIKQAITAVQAAYRGNFFPAMKVTWKTYPENIGHMISPGCMRCHDGLHVNAQGTAITSDCTVCHTFMNAVEGQPGQFREGKFEHAMALQHHDDLRCSQCHTGGPLPLCRDCHANLQGLNRWEDVGRLRRLGGD